MSKGEKAQLEIEPEWGYGKKGQPDAKYPSLSSEPGNAGGLYGQGYSGGFPCSHLGNPGHSWGCNCPFLLEKNSCRGNLLLFSTSFYSSASKCL